MINKDRLLDEFKVLAAFDSESFHEKDISEYLYKKLLELGLEVSMDDAGHRLMENEKATGNIYGLLRGNTEGDAVLFSAHMDTVAPGNHKKVIVHEDGKVTSAGNTVLGSDDITGLAAILEMLQVIKEENLPHPDIEVAFFVAEEPFCRGSSVFDYSKIKAKKAYVLDLDGPVGTIANQAPSIFRLTVQVKGKSAHAGFAPEAGISAIQIAAKAINEIRLGRIDDNTTANIGIISGGTGLNIVPDSVVLKGEVRTLSRQRALEIIENIREAFNESADFFGGQVLIDYLEGISAYKVDENSEVIVRYANVLKKLGYGNVTVKSTFGGSDNNNFNLHGIEGIVIANAMNNVHTVNEYFYIDEFVKSAEIVLHLAIS